MLADLESLEKRLNNLQKKARGGDKESAAQLALVEPIIKALTEGKPARTAIPEADRKMAERLQLLTAKPVLYVCNVEEASAATGNAFSEKVAVMAAEKGAAFVVVSAAIEAEVSQLPEEEQGEYLEGLGLTESGLARVIRRRLPVARPYHLFHRGSEGNACLDHRARLQGAAGPPASSMAISSAASLPAKPSPLMTMSPERARPARGRPASCASKARNSVVKDGDVLLFRFTV